MKRKAGAKRRRPESLVRQLKQLPVCQQNFGTEQTGSPGAGDPVFYLDGIRITTDSADLFPHG